MIAPWLKKKKVSHSFTLKPLSWWKQRDPSVAWMAFILYNFLSFPQELFGVNSLESGEVWPWWIFVQIAVPCAVPSGFGWWWCQPCGDRAHWTALNSTTRNAAENAGHSQWSFSAIWARKANVLLSWLSFLCQPQPLASDGFQHRIPKLRNNIQTPSVTPQLHILQTGLGWILSSCVLVSATGPQTC